ncbi:hypothetical protein MCOR25_001217 [Pyricularia grisea]|nr:hypothetical protein MCOR25_001217 [Pyricularia grisea]
MVSQSYLLSLAAICVVVNAAPLPLNINLGAYSPALVVGDGAIEFEGAAKNSVESIINTLQGAAAAGATRAAATEGAAQPATSSQAATTQQQGLGLGAKAVDTGILNEKASLPLPGSAPLGPRSEKVEVEEEDAEEEEEDASAPLQKRQNEGFQAALNYAEKALTKGPKIQMGTPAAGVGIIVDNTAGKAAA